MNPSPLSIVTYNVQFNKALEDVVEIVKQHSPDVVCLQEINLGKRDLYEPLLPGYALAATSNSFYRMGKTFGLATFYKTSSLYQRGSKSVFLPRTFYEIVISILTWRGPRTALRTDFTIKGSGKNISIYNLHLTALVATNKARNKQLQETLEDLELYTKESAVVLGDFNYPFRKRGLEKIIHYHGLVEATASVFFTWKMNILHWKLRWKFDYVLYKDLELIDSVRLDEFRRSDHFPVLTTFMS